MQLGAHGVLPTGGHPSDLTGSFRQDDRPSTPREPVDKTTVGVGDVRPTGALSVSCLLKELAPLALSGGSWAENDGQPPAQAPLLLWHRMIETVQAPGGSS